MCPHLFGRNISNWTEKSFAFNVAAVHSRPKYAYRPQTRVCHREFSFRYEAEAETEYVKCTFADTPDQGKKHYAEYERLSAEDSLANERFGLLRRIGIGLCTASLLAFVAGSVVSGWALMTKIQDEHPAQMKIGPRGNFI